MSKKVKTIIFGSAVILLLVAILVVLQLTKEKPNPDAGISDVSKDFVTLIKEDQNALQQLSIKNIKDEYVIKLQGENKLGIDSLMDFKQTDYLYLETAAMASNVVATEVVEENCTNLAKFGLDKPSLVFQTKFKDNKTYSISAGAISSDKKVRYACETGKNTVYAFSSNTFTNFDFDRYEYLDKVVIPGFESDKVQDIPIIDSMSVSRPDLEKPIILEKFKEGELGENAGMQSNVKMVSPLESLISETPTQTYIFGNFGILAKSIVKAKPTEQELKDYGFDKPTSVFEIKYNQTSSVKITTGKRVESTNDTGEKTVTYFAMRDGINQVYVVNADDMKWMEMQPKDLISPIAVLPNILDISSIDIKLANKDHKLTYTKGEDKKDVKSITATFDNKKVELDNAKKYLQLLYDTSIQDLSKLTPPANPTASLKYNYTNGKTDLIDIYVLEDRTCIITINKKNVFKGRAAYVDKLIKETDNLSNGKIVDTDW